MFEILYKNKVVAAEKFLVDNNATNRIEYTYNALINYNRIADRDPSLFGVSTKRRSRG